MDLSEPAVGKTAPACVSFWWLWSHKQERSVWSMPKSLMKKNRLEALMWSEFSETDVVIVDGPPAKRAAQMKSDAKLFIMGFDCFANNWAELLGYHPDINFHAVDEFHLGFGGATSNRTLQLFESGKQIERFLPMTGTIINGKLSTVYPCIHMIEPDLYPYGFEEFEMAHALKDAYGRTVSWVNTKKISQFLKRNAVRVTFEQAYGKEAKELIPELCQMTPLQRQCYDEFEEEGLLELESSWLDGTLPGVNFIRCRQIMEHPQEFGPPLDKIKDTGKEERLRIHLEHSAHTGKPLVIFSALVPQHDRLVALAESYKLRVGIINGKVSSKKRFEIDDAFRAGDLDVVIASPATAGVGFNWGHVDTMVFMSVDPMDSSFVQGYRRAIRGKRETPLLIYVMEYENSMDQRMFQIIDQKSKLAHDVDSSKERLDLTRSGRKRTGMKPTMEAFQGV